MWWLLDYFCRTFTGILSWKVLQGNPSRWNFQNPNFHLTWKYYCSCLLPISAQAPTPLSWRHMSKSMLGKSLFEIKDLGCQDQLLVSVLTEFSNQDQSWYCCRLKFYFMTSLGLIWNLVLRIVLVLVSRRGRIKTKSRPNMVRIRNLNMYTVSSAGEIPHGGRRRSRADVEKIFFFLKSRASKTNIFCHFLQVLKRF